IDGVDVRDLRSEDYRKQISVIYQDYGQYHLSARDNILLGSPDLARNDPAIIAAAKWANIHDDLMALPQGYDSVMSRSLADGEEFSGGQWQKLALARAFVRGSQLIILDEPTSALDAAAESAFFQQFRKMAHGRAALIISHRFSTVRLATRIYVLAQGRVIEEGTHDELIVVGGVYASLYRQQASYYKDATRETFSVHTGV
ncbi:MAG: ATP-binding cassette domain-containing protein, partial [Candidatus Methylophosphatis roskildensis]